MITHWWHFNCSQEFVEGVVFLCFKCSVYKQERGGGLSIFKVCKYPGKVYIGVILSHVA